jgi:hypothetical protein
MEIEKLLVAGTNKLDRQIKKFLATAQNKSTYLG